jgi:hypothetical protein
MTTWRPKHLDDKFLERVRAIHASMVEAVGAAISESDIDALRCIVRLAVEFKIYIEHTDVDAPDRNHLEYACETIFSGLDSFTTLLQAYNSLVGGIEGTVTWDTVNTSSLRTFKDHFLSAFNKFDGEPVFELKCQFLLDLYKLQLIFAGFMYGRKRSMI